jgi:hypothetical protein
MPEKHIIGFVDWMNPNGEPVDIYSRRAVQDGQGSGDMYDAVISVNTYSCPLISVKAP